MSSPALGLVDSTVATTTQRQEVVEFVVPALPSGRCTKAVEVVNVQIVICAAVLAGVLVAFQCGLAISTKGEIVLGLGCVLCCLFWIACRPSANSGDVVGRLAPIASLLRAGSVFEVFSAILAKERSSNRNTASKNPALFEGLLVLLRSVRRAASWAHFLSGRFWFVCDAAPNASALCIAGLCLSVRLKGARATPFRIRGQAGNVRAAPKTFDGSVSSHEFNLKFAPSHYMQGGV